MNAGLQLEIAISIICFRVRPPGRTRATSANVETSRGHEKNVDVRESVLYHSAYRPRLLPATAGQPGPGRCACIVPATLGPSTGAAACSWLPRWQVAHSCSPRPRSPAPTSGSGSRVIGGAAYRYPPRSPRPRSPAPGNGPGDHRVRPRRVPPLTKRPTDGALGIAPTPDHPSGQPAMAPWCGTRPVLRLAAGVAPSRPGRLPFTWAPSRPAHIGWLTHEPSARSLTGSSEVPVGRDDPGGTWTVC